jgi:cytochrome c oxidase subunit 2
MLILVAMAVPATKTLIRMADARDAELTIKVTGYQWRWHYQYLNENIGFFSTLSTPQAQIHNDAAQERTLPAGSRSADGGAGRQESPHVLTTAGDVIHSWWVPALAIKKDAIPGFINESWTQIDKPGIYRGQCAELCGKDHGFMPIVVEALPEAEFKQWVEKMKASNPNTLTASGGKTL